MIKLIFTCCLLALCFAVLGQMQTVQLNARKLQFDDGRELPAEKAFIVSADAGLPVALLKMQVSASDFEEGKILYESKWVRKDADNSTVAIMPNHYKLRSGRDYSFRFQYYRRLMEPERRQIQTMLEKTAYSLVKTNIAKKGKRYRFAESPSDIYQALNRMIEEGMVNFETTPGAVTPRFSGVVENLLFTMAREKMVEDSAGIRSGERRNALHRQLANEIQMITNQYQYALQESVVIPEYPVERKNNYLAVHVGYGGVYDDGDFSDLEYFSGPYAGISFPLGNRVFAGNFWNNASVSAGVFLRNFKTSDSTKATGPIVKRPLYAALGYKFLNYFKIHAGAAVLEESEAGNNSKSVFVKPFVGLSAEVNLWLGSRRK